MCRLDISRRRTRVFLANSPTCFPSRDGSKIGHHGFIYFLEPIIVTHTHLKPLKSPLKIGDIYIYTQNSLSILLKSSYILHGPMDKICINHIYIYTHTYSCIQNPLHVSSCYCCGYRFWGGPIAFQGFMEVSIFEIQHEAKIHS